MWRAGQLALFTAGQASRGPLLESLTGMLRGVVTVICTRQAFRSTCMPCFQHTASSSRGAPRAPLLRCDNLMFARRRPSCHRRLPSTSGEQPAAISCTRKPCQHAWNVHVLTLHRCVNARWPGALPTDPHCLFQIISTANNSQHPRLPAPVDSPAAFPADSNQQEARFHSSRPAQAGYVQARPCTVCYPRSVTGLTSCHMPPPAAVAILRRQRRCNSHMHGRGSFLPQGHCIIRF